MSLDTTISQLLSECGFETSPRRVLAQLLLRGPSTAGILARRSSLKRPTVYAVLNGLIDQGLVQRSRRQRSTYFSVASPQVFSDLIAQRAQTSYDRVKNATTLIARHLISVPDAGSLDFGGYELSTIENSRDFYHELELALSKGSYCGIFNPQVAIVGISRAMVERFLQRTAQSRSPIREIMVPGPEGEWYKQKIRNPLHQLKEFPAGAKLTTDMIFSDGVVILAQYGSNREIAVKIRHQEYYQSMLTIFNTLWASLPCVSLDPSGATLSLKQKE